MNDIESAAMEWFGQLDSDDHPAHQAVVAACLADDWIGPEQLRAVVLVEYRKSSRCEHDHPDQFTPAKCESCGGRGYDPAFVARGGDGYAPRCKSCAPNPQSDAAERQGSEG